VIRIVKENNPPKNDEIVYTEWVPLGKFVKILILFVCLLILSLGITFSAFLHKDLVFIGIILGGVSVLIFLMYWNYRGLKITLTSNKLEVAYGIFNHKEIPLKKITNCNITKTNFRTYGGIGIRIGLDGSRAYNTDFGEAVKVTFQYGRPFVFSTKNPQKICNLIHELSN
jgi:uncharacterized membrane protein YdbT with pleckstrin-like domain